MTPIKIIDSGEKTQVLFVIERCSKPISKRHFTVQVECVLDDVP